MYLSYEANGSYRWWLIAMLWFVCFCNYADRQAIFSIFPLLHTELHLSNVELGIVGSSFMWVYALAGPLAGWLSDRISPRTVILGALGFWSVITAGTAICHHFGSLVAFRALGGLGEAFYFPAAMALIGIYHSGATRSRAMALHQSSVYAGTIAGGSLSALVAQTYSWRWSFLSFGMAGVLLMLFLLFALRRPPLQTKLEGQTTEHNFFRNVREVLSQGNVVLLIVVFAGANFVAVVFLTWLPTYLFNRFHLSLAQAGWSSTVYLQVASVCGVLTGGVLADRLAQRMRGGRLLIQAIGLIGAVPFLFLTGWSVLLALFIVATIGFGFFKGLYDANIWASLYDLVPVERRGVAAGTMNSIGWLGGGFAPVLIAKASARFSLGECLSATSAIALGLGVVLLMSARRMNRKTSLDALSV